MKSHVVLVSGRICTWKSKLAQKLSEKRDFQLVSTSEILKNIANDRNRPTDRSSLQELGDELDSETKFQWVFDHISEELNKTDKKYQFVVDHIRHKEQLLHFRNQNDFKIVHVHLFAKPHFLRSEFERRTKDEIESCPLTFDKADPLHGNDDDILWFKRDADVRIDVTRTDAEDTFVRVCAALHINPDQKKRCVDVVVGGQYGSEGKGNIVAYLAKEYDVLVRVGGPNAGHTVAGKSGQYTYHHLPSGSKDCDAELLLGPGMTIDVKALLTEISECGISEERLYIDPDAMIIEEKDKTDEGLLKNNISSTASGSGAASARRIMQRSGTVRLAKNVPELEQYVGCENKQRGSTLRRLELAFSKRKSVLLEGTQGSGLSIFHGPYPHVTSRDTNVAGCLAEAGISPARVRKIIMVTRTTPIRVADPDTEGKTSGFLKHPTDFETVAKEAGLDFTEVKEAEKTSTTKRNRRVGWFDWELFRKSCKLNAPTDIALTFADYLSSKNQSAHRYEQLTPETINFIEELELVSQARVTLINTRFPKPKDHSTSDLRSLIDRRNWRGGKRE